jgi:hypothetical protein
MGVTRLMKRRMLEWIGITSLLLSIALAVLWADSVLAGRRYDVLSLTKNLNFLVANGNVVFFGGLEEAQPIELRVFMPRTFGAPGPLKEHSYFDWFIPALGVRYCFVTGLVSLPPVPGMGTLTISYAEFTIPGISYHRHHESQLEGTPWSLSLTLLLPLLFFLVILGICSRSLLKCRRPHSPSPGSQAVDGA